MTQLSANCAKRHQQLRGQSMHIEGSYDCYDGWMQFDDQVIHCEGEACFALWENTHYDYTLEAVGYNPRMDMLEFDCQEIEHMYQVGWDEIIQKVWTLLPTYAFLLDGEELSFDLDAGPLREANFNFRMARCFHEQPDYVTSCAWIHHHYPDLDPVIVAVCAALHRVDGDGAVGHQQADPHMSLTIRNTVGEVVTLMRCLHHTATNGGYLWGEDYAELNDRQFQGIDAEIKRNSSRRWNLSFSDTNLNPQEEQAARALPFCVDGDTPMERLVATVTALCCLYDATVQVGPGATLFLSPAALGTTQKDFDLQMRKEVKPW